jgi:hypothetical protein
MPSCALQCLLAYNAFLRRGYCKQMLDQKMRLLDWGKRSYFRNKVLTPKAKVVPGGGAVSSPQYDPVMKVYLRLGAGGDLRRARRISTGGASDQVQEAIGPILATVFPERGAIAAPKMPSYLAV